eukprot:31107-Chlamydomonas_euryale.AAC.1
MVEGKQIEHVSNERHILDAVRDCPFCVNLVGAYQDAKSLYLLQVGKVPSDSKGRRTRWDDVPSDSEGRRKKWEDASTDSKGTTKREDAPTDFKGQKGTVRQLIPKGGEKGKGKGASLFPSPPPPS